MVLDQLKWQVGELHPTPLRFPIAQEHYHLPHDSPGALRSRSGIVVFLDLEKDFEVANQSAILEALAEKGVRGRLLQ